MRQLREAVENVSDLILTGHEHVPRSLREVVNEAAAFEYREGDALQDGIMGEFSGFHLLKLDFDNSRQVVTTYRWETAADSYVRAVGPLDAQLGRNRQRSNQAHRLRSEFETRLNDPELPITHAKRGTLRLADFYTYPDIKQIGDGDEASKRLPGEVVLSMVRENRLTLLLGPDRCGKSCLATRLFADLHRQGDVPLLVDGKHLKNCAVGKLTPLAGVESQRAVRFAPTRIILANRQVIPCIDHG